MKTSLLAVVLVLFVSCGGNDVRKKTSDILANTKCVLNIEGMMCEKGCKTTIEQKLSEVKGVVSCKVEFEENKVNLDFDNNYTTTNDLIIVVNEIAGGIYKASLLEESVFIPAGDSKSISGGDEIDEVSVSDYSFQLPSFSNIFSDMM